MHIVHRSSSTKSPPIVIGDRNVEKHTGGRRCGKLYLGELLSSGDGMRFREHTPHGPDFAIEMTA
jgi:hypothetical protein